MKPFDIEILEETRSEMDREIERLASELATTEKINQGLRRKLNAMKDFEADSKLKDRKITLLEKERLEAQRTSSVKIRDLERRLSGRLDVIEKLEATIKRHQKSMANFQQLRVFR